jgi:hypothetical protein
MDPNQNEYNHNMPYGRDTGFYGRQENPDPRIARFTTPPMRPFMANIHQRMGRDTEMEDNYPHPEQSMYDLYQQPLMDQEMDDYPHLEQSTGNPYQAIIDGHIKTEREESPDDHMDHDHMDHDYHHLSSDQIKAEREDSPDYHIVHDHHHHVPSDQISDHRMAELFDYTEYYDQYCSPPQQHEDSDLALDRIDYTDDSQFDPRDSNIFTHPTPTYQATFDRSGTYNSATDPTYDPDTFDVYTTPSSRYDWLEARSKADVDAYNRSTRYWFNTAAELLHPDAFASGWPPEAYAGLTNPIPVPASAYQRRPKRNPSDQPVRRTVLHTHADLAMCVGFMRRPITPIHQQGTGLIHPDFPTTVGAMALMTEAQMDSMAEFYHQTGYSEWWLQYPSPMVWRRDEDNVWLKRRKMSEFIGIRRPRPPPGEVVGWMNELEAEIERRMAEARGEEEKREDLRRKMFFCKGGEL